MKLLKPLNFLLILLLITAPLLLIYSPTKAQEGPISLGFAPTDKKLVLKPGELYEGTFTVWNLSSNTATYYVYVSGFKQVETHPGTAIPLSPGDDQKDPYSASSWVDLELEQLPLEPQKNVEINYTIKVPANVALGEYNAMIFLSTDNTFEDAQGSGASSNLASGPVILIQVGDIDNLQEEAELIKFKTEKYIYEQPPVAFETILENSGVTHITPQADIIIENLAGTEVARLPLNPRDISILRGSSGTYRTEWAVSRPLLTSDNKLLVGPMKAKLILTYKKVQPGFSPITSETTFWIIPWKLILALVAAVILIVAGLKVRSQRK